MSQPQDGPVRIRQKRRRTRQLEAWRAKQSATPAKAATPAPAAKPAAKAKPASAKA